MSDKNALSIATMTTNVNVGIDEVVAIFVSRYETDLYGKKDALATKVKSLKGKIDGITAELKKSVNKADYEGSVEKLGLKYKVDSIEVLFEKSSCNYSQKVGIAVSIGIYDASSDRTYPVHTKSISLPINAMTITERKELQGELDTANAELLEVMGLIKTVGRKERQVRGKIAEMKLEQAGQNELLANGELVKLISMS